jgi:hypothetical protein
MWVADLILCRFVNVRLLNLLDGSPHEVPLRKVLSLDLPHNLTAPSIGSQISSSRIALMIEPTSFAVARLCKKIVAWDWRTGEVVSDLRFSWRPV